MAADARTRDGCPAGSVVNISLGGSYSAALNGAAAALVSSGVFVAVASGGSGKDASRYSPASEPSVCTIGASNQDDRAASYSNYGSLVDVFAPGSSVLSTWNADPTSTVSHFGSLSSASHFYYCPTVKVQ